MPLQDKNCLNSALTKEGPLSVATISGNPNWENKLHKCSMILAEVDVCIGNTYIRFNPAAMTTKNI